MIIVLVPSYPFLQLVLAVSRHLVQYLQLLSVFGNYLWSALCCHCLCPGSQWGLSWFSLSLDCSLGSLSWSTLCSCSFCFSIPLRLWGGDWMVSGQSGIFSFLGPVDGMEVLEQPTCRRLICWLSREAKAGVGGTLNFPWYRGPRESGVTHSGWPLTSWSFLCSSRLCFRVSLRFQRNRRVLCEWDL